MKPWSSTAIVIGIVFILGACSHGEVADQKSTDPEPAPSPLSSTAVGGEVDGAAGGLPGTTGEGCKGEMKAEDTEEQPRSCQRVLARIDGIPVCAKRAQAAVDARMANNNGNYGDPFRRVQLERKVIEMVITVELLRRVAAKQRIELPERDLASLAEHYSDDPYGFLEAEYGLLNSAAGWPKTTPRLEADEVDVEVLVPGVKNPLG